METDDDDIFLLQLGKRISKLRSDKQMSQSDLGGLINMEVPYLSSIENGRQNPTIHTLRKIANGLRVELKELF